MSDETDQLIRSVEARLIRAEMQHMRSDMGALASSVADIRDSLAILTRLEQSHMNLLERIAEGSRTMEKQDGRLQKIEVSMPGLLEMRKWVVGGVLAGVSMMGMALVKLVLVDPVSLIHAAQIAPK